MERTFMLAPKMPLGSFTIAHDNFDKGAVHNLFESFLMRHVCKPAIEIDWRAKIMGIIVLDAGASRK